MELPESGSKSRSCNHTIDVAIMYIFLKLNELISLFPSSGQLRTVFGLVTFMITNTPPKNPDALEWFLLVWVIAMAWEELMQVKM